MKLFDKNHTYIAASLAGAAIALTASYAQASPGAYLPISDTDLIIAGLLVAAIVAEPIVPDLHLEFGDGIGGSKLTQVWPIPVSFGALKMNNAFGVGFTALAEIQKRQHIDRFTYGARIPFFITRVCDSNSTVDASLCFGEGVFAEVGGIAGDEGAGFWSGGGLMFGGPLAALSLGYRLTTLGTKRRHSVTLELHVALPVFLLYPDTQPE